MAKMIDFTIAKSYATRENAVKAFDKKFGESTVRCVIVARSDGRFTPAGIGADAMINGVHFHFPVVG